jgi:hypothetical protein
VEVGPNTSSQDFNNRISNCNLEILARNREGVSICTLLYWGAHHEGCVRLKEERGPRVAQKQDVHTMRACTSGVEGIGEELGMNWRRKK